MEHRNDSKGEKMRYTIKATFHEEQRRGFVVTHQLEKQYNTAAELTEGMAGFLQGYNSEYCNHMDFHVIENDDRC